MQIAKIPYKSIVHCAKDVFKTEGIRAYYLSFPTTLLMNIPYFSVQFMTYESMKRFLSKKDYNQHTVALVAGSIAGMAGAACSNPFDVIKTHLQTKTSQYTGLAHATREIYLQSGVKGFFAGITARMAFFGLSSGALWLSYEWMKRILFHAHHEK
jgi:solute carrier family 25 iron transporter 28/37